MQPLFEITQPLVTKLLRAIDAGLVAGLGTPEPGAMCIEAAVCFAMGLPHGDEPTCVSFSLRRLKIRLNDAWWSTPTARAAGLRRLGVAQLGSAGVLDESEFRRRLIDDAIRLTVPYALRAGASRQKSARHRKALEEAANHCERDGTLKSARAARDAAAFAAAGDAGGAAAAATSAASAIAYGIADVHPYVAIAAAYAADAAHTVADRDEYLAAYAERVVQILVSMNAPGCEWLWMTEGREP